MIDIDSYARRYPALYLKPGVSLEVYKNCAAKGRYPDDKSLSHFSGSKDDQVIIEETSQGKVEILFFDKRQDFETAVKLLAYKGRENPIPITMGAITLNGLVNWEKIYRHKEDYLNSGGSSWPLEFMRFTANPDNYRDTVILLSNGPYSDVSFLEAGFEEKEWLQVSRIIRHYHELTHVICRRKYPENIHPLIDEVFADAMGLVLATGKYDPKLAAAFLGISSSGYSGGRLENYLSEEQKEYVDTISLKMQKIIFRVENHLTENPKNNLEDMIDLLENGFNLFKDELEN